MNNKALMPEYMSEFKCIGADCEDSCCALWQVPIDHMTYKKYQSVDHPTLSKDLKDGLTVNKPNVRTKGNYASINLNPESQACCFHKNGLCSIQIELGESYLSSTCATYPRKLNEVNGVQEVSTVFSCPEAARLVLLNPNGIQFEFTEPLVGSNFQIDNRVNTQQSNVSPYAKYFWDLRMTSIELLQNRRFSLPHRIMQLAVLAEQVDECIQKGSHTTIPEVLAKFREDLAQGEEVTDKSIFPTDHSFQVRFLNDLLMTIYEKKLSHNTRYTECLEQYLEGMQQAEGKTTEEIVAFYEQIYSKYYKPFMDEHEYIFENYFVNHIYTSLFPLPSQNDPTMLANLFHICVVFCLIRMQLIGMSAVRQELNSDMVIKLVQSFSKNFEHRPKSKLEIRDKCKKEGVTTLGHLSLLIMNV